MNGAGRVLCALAIMISLTPAITGCASKSSSNAKAQEAFLAGQNAALQQTQQFPTVTVLGPVQNHSVPWVAGLTLVQAVATANYLDSHPPKSIIITRQGESATLNGDILPKGTIVPLEPGDTVDFRY